MKSRRSKILILIGGLIIMTISWYGYREFDREHIFLHDSAAEISITPEDLFAEFEEDENSANERYLDKIVELQGEVSKVEVHDHTKVISFEGGMMGGVSCELDPRLPHELPEAGEMATVRGKCTGYLMDVHLVQSVLIKQ